MQLAGLDRGDEVEAAAGQTACERLVREQVICNTGAAMEVGVRGQRDGSAEDFVRSSSEVSRISTQFGCQDV